MDIQRENNEARISGETHQAAGGTLSSANGGALASTGGTLTVSKPITETSQDLAPTATLVSSNTNHNSMNSGAGQVEASTNKLEASVPDTQSSGNTRTEQGNNNAKPSTTTESDTAAAAKDDESSMSSSSRVSTKKKKPKKDRSKLRKGKWTPEEEEYTSRIIHYFSTGILTLPEGKTIRGYLADKLNCDPMRITKKYAGAACLGKRVYHVCDRPPPTVTEVEMAKADLAQLEQRFRLRVEHGQTGVPLPPRNDLLPGTNVHMCFTPAQMGGMLQNLAAANAAGATPGTFAPAPAPTAAQSSAGAPAAWPGTVLPFLNPNALMAGVVPGLQVMAPNGQANPFAALAWAQAAASLTPAISQLAAANAANLQQQQQGLQKAFEARLQDIAKQAAAGSVAAAPTTQANAQPARDTTTVKTMAPPFAAVQTLQAPAVQVNAAQAAPLTVAKPKPSAPSSTSSPRSKEDEDAGSMLMGFLSSLRKGYEEALSEREQIEGRAAPATLTGHKRQGSSEPPSAAKRPRIPASRTTFTERMETESGTTSYPAESSLEDSDEAGKNKQDHSSSEGDSDKDSSERGCSGGRGSSSEEGGSVPPRKRMKGKHSVGEFTRQNVAEHNHLMDVMRSRLGTTQQDPSNLGWPRDGRTDLDD